jgi:hypothetical protein
MQLSLSILNFHYYETYTARVSEALDNLNKMALPMILISTNTKL